MVVPRSAAFLPSGSVYCGRMPKMIYTSPQAGPTGLSLADPLRAPCVRRMAEVSWLADE